MNQMNQKEWKEILSKVFKRAATDEQFRQLCLKDPHTAIKQVSGKDIPKSINIRFVDQTEGLVLTLPAKGAEELTDAQLEALAGGVSILPINLKPGAGAAGAL